MRGRVTLLAGLLVCLVIVFAGALTIEYFRNEQQSSQISALSSRLATLESSGEVVVAASRSFGQEGQIVIGNLGTFDFKAANYTEPNTFTFQNVTFRSTPEVTTGALCALFNATLQSGATYQLAACAFGTSSGGVQTVISLTEQAVPQAGVMLLPDRTAYVLVRARS